MKELHFSNIYVKIVITNDSWTLKIYWHFLLCFLSPLNSNYDSSSTTRIFEFFRVGQWPYCLFMLIHCMMSIKIKLNGLFEVQMINQYDQNSNEQSNFKVGILKWATILHKLVNGKFNIDLMKILTNIYGIGLLRVFSSN